MLEHVDWIWIELWCHPSDCQYLWVFFSFSTKRGRKILLCTSLSQPFFPPLAHLLCTAGCLNRFLWSSPPFFITLLPSGFKVLCTCSKSSCCSSQGSCIQKKKKTRWNSLQNFLWIGQLWQKSKSPFRLHHFVAKHQSNSCRVTVQQSWESHTSKRSDLYQLGNARRLLQHQNRLSSPIVLFRRSGPAQIVIDAATWLTARPHFEPFR